MITLILFLLYREIPIIQILAIFHKAVTHDAAQSGNVIGRLFNARKGENNFSIDTRDRICVMVVKSRECFPKGGIKRNVSLDFRTEIEAVFSFLAIPFSSRQKDPPPLRLPSIFPFDQCVRSRDSRICGAGRRYYIITL